MTTSTQTSVSAGRNIDPSHLTNVNQPSTELTAAAASGWNAGATEELNDVHVDKEDTGHEAAGTAAAKMHSPAATTAHRQAQHNADSGTTSSCPTISYLHGCTAASVALIILSVASFVVPSISTYGEERATVQAVGYTAGSISLLAGVLTGACVASMHTKSGDWRS